MEEIREGYTRVSELLKHWVSFDGIDPGVLENKRRIGTNVHDRIAADHNRIFLDLQEDESPYYESWIEWAKSTEFKILESEKRLYSETFKITGKYDAIIEHEGRSILIDFKTSASPNHIVWETQGGLYHWLCVENGKMLADEVWFMQLLKTGKKAKLHRYMITSELMGDCMAILRAHRRFNR